jgi:hypothetical protein
MSQETNKGLPAESSQESSRPDRGPARKADYEIGYGKPPKATRFKKGQSGNPAGAKKKVAVDDVRVMVEEVLAELITLRDGGKDRKVSRLEAMLRTQILNGLKGDSKAAKAVFRLSQKGGMFSQAKRRGTVVIDPPGSTPEDRMLLRAFHAEQESQLLEQRVGAGDRSINRSKG